MLSERWIRRETTLTGSRALSHSNKAPSTQQKLETFLIVGKIYNLKIEKKKKTADTWKVEMSTRNFYNKMS